MPRFQDLLQKLTHFSAWRLFKRVESHTMVGHPRLYALYELMERIETQKMSGDIVECGVWKGGAAGVIASIMKRFGNQRTLWLFDSFAGMPEPSTQDGKKAEEQYAKDKGISHVEDVTHLLQDRLGIQPSVFKIVPGWFQDTFPRVKDQIRSIALLRLDCDWYESTKICLETFYERVVPGGYVLVDDYGSWPGCKQAIDEFLATQEGVIDLKPAGSGAVYFQKPLATAAASYWRTETQRYKQPHLRLKRLAQEIVERTPKKGTVLDIGCGPGTLGVLLQKHGLNYSGVDVFEQAVPYGRYHAFDLIQSPIEQFPFTQTFDTIVISGVLEYLPQERIQQLLAYLGQHLATPTSTLLITFTNFQHYSQSIAEYHPQWITTVRPSILKSWFDAAHLTLERAYPTYYFILRRRLPWSPRFWIPFFSSLFGRQLIFVLRYVGKK